MRDLSGLPAAAFGKYDTASDELFYAEPRFVTHIDAGAIAAVTALYRELFPLEGVILDLMSSWVSHLPGDVPYREVIGHGMNERELAANPRLSRFFECRRRGDLRVGAISAKAGGCAARARPCAEAWKPGRDHLFKPLFPNQGGHDLAGSAQCGSSKAGDVLSRTGGLRQHRGTHSLSAGP